MTQQLAKSLHTVSVLVNVTKYLMELRGIPAEPALVDAVELLKLSDKDDVYNLKATALRQLNKGE